MCEIIEQLSLYLVGAMELVYSSLIQWKINPFEKYIFCFMLPENKILTSKICG